jgi:hypothetical protein
MRIDWGQFALYAAPVLALLVGAVLDRFLERRPKLINYFVHATAVQVNPPNGVAFVVHTHSLVVRNTGRETATDVRLGHHVLPPNYSIYPAIPHTVVNAPGGAVEIVVPSLVPNEQIPVTYLYYPPLVFGQVHSYVKHAKGFAKGLYVLPTPQAAPWLLWMLRALVVLGLVTVIYAAADLIRWAISR